MCFTLKVLDGSCIAVSNLTLVPSCVSAWHTVCAPLGAWRHFTDHSDASSVSAGHFLDASVSVSRCGHRGSGLLRNIGLFLENNWCCISTWAHRERRTSPPQGKVFISPPNTLWHQAESSRVYLQLLLLVIGTFTLSGLLMRMMP